MTQALPPRRRKPGRPARTDDDAAPPAERLLHAAITLFARYGYDPVSTGDIARAADFTQSMVHYHFGTKEQLWRAAVLHLMRRRGAAFPVSRLRRSELDPLAKLEMLVRRLVAANAAEPDYASLIVQESIARTERLDWLIEQFIRPGYELFDTTIAEAVAAGAIKPFAVQDITTVVISTASLSFGLAPMIERLHGVPAGSDQHLQALTDCIVDILFNGLTADR
jgi:AcrR family transcriptional regulator